MRTLSSRLTSKFNTKKSKREAYEKVLIVLTLTEFTADRRILGVQVQTRSDPTVRGRQRLQFEF